jgi:hypothetical protein
MNAAKLVGVLLIVAGVLALIYGGFTYTKEDHAAKLGPLEFSVKRNETVAVPVWVGAGGVALGTLLLLMGGRKP